MRAEFFAGARHALPIMLAYLMLGAAAGVFGAERGLSPAEIGLMSLLLFAGSAQFVFPELYGGPPQGVASAIFFINLRHLLYSTALAQQARHLPARTRAAIGAQLTDETFLTATAHLRGAPLHSGAWMIGLNMASYLSWFTGNVAGALAGGAVDLSVVGVEFAGSAMFIALLLPQIAGHARPPAAAMTAVASGAAAAAAFYVYPDPAIIVASATLSAALGVLLFGVNESDRDFAASLQKQKEA